MTLALPSIDLFPCTVVLMNPSGVPSTPMRFDPTALIKCILSRNTAIYSYKIYMCVTFNKIPL